MDMCVFILSFNMLCVRWLISNKCNDRLSINAEMPIYVIVNLICTSLLLTFKEVLVSKLQSK